ncbi:MAG: hypothetical protein EBU90_04205 [Proteobacteria bacterium]|nr:hypothetical protein [Pseudomonadota bacterium]NBP13904.1 hypothetical protein [bacterium]
MTLQEVMDAEYIREVIGRIDKLDSKEKTHILSILKGTNNTFTKNANGYFFNLAVVPEETINKIVKCVELIEKNRDLIKDMDLRRESLLTYYKGIIEETLLSSMRNKREKYVSMLRVVPLDHNMTLSINRKQTIKWRYKHDHDVDPDELMKEYHKSRYVYEKKSVYGRIWARMKAIRSGRGKGSGCEAADDSDTFGSGRDLPDYEEGDGDAEYYEDGDGDGGDGEGEGALGYSEDAKQSEDAEESQDTEDTEEPEHPDEYDKTVPEEENEDEHEDTVEDNPKSNQKLSKTSKTTKSKSKTDTENTDTHEQEMTFYKRLLNQQGFKFREKVIALAYQPYIE